MRRLLTTILVTSAALTLIAADETPLKDQKDKVSYMLGMNMGRQLKQSNVEVNPEIYLRGLKDSLTEGKTLMTEAEARAVMQEFQTELRAKQQEMRQAEAGKNKEAGEAFLAENQKKEGMKVTKSGLQYKVLATGTGATPTSSDTVVVHYRGTLVDGTEFDSSYKRGEPASFPVTGVIKGWTEALLMMSVGSKWQLTIPAGLAYGDRGRPNIPPGSVLQFDVELIDIKKPEDVKPPSPPNPQE